MNYNQLLNTIEQMNGGLILTKDGIIKKEYAKALAIKKIACLIDSETNQNVKNDIYDDAMGFISRNLSDTDQQQKDYLDNYSKNFSDDFFNALILDNYQKYCPEKLPILCKKIAKYKSVEITNEWCSDVCSILDQCRDDRQTLDNYIFGFEQDELRRMWDWRLSFRLLFAFQFGGNELANQMCQKISEIEEVKGIICKVLVLRMDMRANYDCDQVADTLSQLICSEEFDYNH